METHAIPAEFKLNGSETLRAEVKLVDMADNRFRGRAAGIGNMDRGGDVLAPGCFSAVGKEFKKSGEILIGHDWGGGAGVATIESCGEVGDSYEIEAEFYTTPDAQIARQKLIERTDRGKTTGLSIGFQVDPASVVYFATGDEMAAYCKKSAINIDSASARAWKGYCRLILKIAALFETSIVTVPMNPRAYSTAVKNLYGGDGSQVPDTLESHLETVLATVDGATARFRRYWGTRGHDSRPVSEDRLNQALSINESLTTLLTEVRSGQAEPGKQPDLELLKLRRRRLAIA